MVFVLIYSCAVSFFVHSESADAICWKKNASFLRYSWQIYLFRVFIKVYILVAMQSTDSKSLISEWDKQMCLDTWISHLNASRI